MDEELATLLETAEQAIFESSTLLEDAERQKAAARIRIALTEIVVLEQRQALQLARIQTGR